MTEPCKSCKNHIYIARDGAAICRKVECGYIRPYKWVDIWNGETPCEYYEKRKKGDAFHLGDNDNDSKKKFQEV